MKKQVHVWNSPGLRRMMGGPQRLMSKEICVGGLQHLRIMYYALFKAAVCDTLTYEGTDYFYHQLRPPAPPSSLEEDTDRNTHE